jgi:predicted esterase
MRREMDGLNPAARDLRQLEAKMILIHGRGDNIIPYTESIALAQTLTPDVPVLLQAMESLLSRRGGE